MAQPPIPQLLNHPLKHHALHTIIIIQRGESEKCRLKGPINEVKIRACLSVQLQNDCEATSELNTRH